MLVTVKVCTSTTLVLLFYVLPLKISSSKISCMFLTLVKIYSVYQFAKDNIVFFEFYPFFFCIKDLFSGATLLSAKSKDGLYPLPFLPQIKPLALIGERVSLTQWHARLGYPSLRVVHSILSKHQLAVSNNKSSSICHACQLGKSHCLLFYLSQSRS